MSRSPHQLGGPLLGSGGLVWRVFAGAALALCFLAAPAVAAAAEPPTVLSVDNASEVSFTTAKVSGSVERAADPDPSSNASCDFEYVSDAQFRGVGFKGATQVPCDVDPITVPGPNPVAAVLTGLKPGIEYHFRLTAANAAGSDSLVATSTFATTAIAAPAVTIAAPTGVTPTSAHFAGTINPQLGPGDPSLYEVRWRFQCTPECLDGDGNPISGPPVPPDNATHPVVGDAALDPNTVYRVSLVASNAGGTVTAGPLFFATGAVPPLARTLAAAAGTGSAQLGAKINPLNSAVTYQFEWGLTAAYGNLVPAAPQPLASADNSFHVVGQTIVGLQPQTAYHYRVHAVNTQTGEEAFGDDRTFTTLSPPLPPPSCLNGASRIGASANLPDCRAFELVTPGLGNAGPSAGWPGISVAAVREDGGALAFAADGTPEQAEGATSTVETLLAARGPGGWSVRSLAPPTPLPSGTFFDDDSATVGLSADLSQSVLWSNQPLAPGAPVGTNLFLRRVDGSFQTLTRVGAPKFTAGGKLAGASRDFSRLFVISTVKQLDADPVAGGNVYEWSGGVLHLVTVLPGVSQEPAPDGGSLPVGALPAVSDSGNEAIFKAAGLPGLYLRIGGQQTIEVSKSQRLVEPDPNPTADATAVGVAADGSKVLFTSSSELTEDANTGRTGGVANDRGADLYSYDVAAGVLTDLTVDDDPADAGRGADVERVLGASRDASYVYFVASGNLAPGATSGDRNLYVWHAGTIEYVGDDPVVDPEVGSSLYVTPDGLHAAFVSTEPQTGYDNVGQPEVYGYRYGVGLECASCRPGGEPPAVGAGTAIVGRALSNDGSRLFFQSADAVVPQAQGGHANVFEYAGGEVRLLTPGEGGPALLAGASADGDDVFIAAFEELSPQGRGAAFGIYDARVGAEVAPPPAAADCQGEGCRGQASAAAVVPTPSSAAFEAPGLLSATAPKSVKGSKMSLRVVVPSGGDLEVLGRGTVPVRKKVSKAGPVAIAVALKPGAAARLRKQGSFRTEVEALFKAGGEGASRAAVTVKFEAAKSKEKKVKK